MEKYKQKSIELAYLLRHDKEYGFDKHGWREVDDLIKNHGYTKEMLEDIVETNSKKRYEFSEDRKRIRARQGHSVNVDVELEEKLPPDILYHGTVESVVPSIKKEGIKKQSRLHVHLSADVATAVTVGARRNGKNVVLSVDTKKMREDGIKFYQSRNGVWLTDYVDPKYLVF